MTRSTTTGPAQSSSARHPGATSRGSGPAAGHLRPLDGLRAVAVLAVLLFHSGATLAKGGSLGVDVFFVLSGFLITLLIVRERAATGRISMTGFYARRARRLFPALLIVIGAVLVYAAAAQSPVGTADLRGGVLGSLFYVSDFQAATGHVPVLSLTEHTWSLSIEEHFYLLWPPLLAWLLGRRNGPRLAAGAAAGAAIASALVAPVLWSGAASIPRLYYGPDSRAQALLIGCLLGLAAGYDKLPSRPAAVRATSAAGVVALLGLVVLSMTLSWRSHLIYTGGLTFIALLSAVVIAAVVVAPGGALARTLGTRPLVAIGRISYGLYLWHWPVFLVLNPAFLGLSWAPTQVVRFAVALILAAASYLLVERWFLKRRSYVTDQGTTAQPDHRPQAEQGEPCRAR